MYMYTKGSLAGAAAKRRLNNKRRGTPSRVGILTVGRHARHSCYRYTQVARGSKVRQNAYKTAAYN